MSRSIGGVAVVLIVFLIVAGRLLIGRRDPRRQDAGRCTERIHRRRAGRRELTTNTERSRR
jgi:hypothetical protein